MKFQISNGDNLHEMSKSVYRLVKNLPRVLRVKIHGSCHAKKKSLDRIRYKSLYQPARPRTLTRIFIVNVQIHFNTDS